MLSAKSGSIDKMTVIWQLGYTARFKPIHDAFSGIAPSQDTAKICFEMDRNMRLNSHNPTISNTELHGNSSQ